MERTENKLLRKTLLMSARAVVCFFVLGIAFSAQAATSLSVPYLEPPAGKNWYQKDWVDVSYGVKRAKACLVNMKSNGLYSAINAVWIGSPDAAIGRAIACHESSGLTGALEYNRSKGQGGACAFQIDPAAGYTDVAKGIGLDPSEFLDTILRDPTYCAKAGRYVLIGHMNASDGAGGKKGLIGGLCNYVGGAHYRQFKKLQNCAMAEELLLVREYVEAVDQGHEPDIAFEVQDDPSQECYGCVKMTGSSGTKVLLNCHNYDMSMSNELALAAINHRSALKISAFARARDTMESMANWTGLTGKVKQKYCIEELVYLEDRLIQFLSLDFYVAALVNMILEMLERILDQVCQIIKTAINSALNLICLPLPHISLPDFNLGGIKGVTCDGLSLADFVKIKSAPRTTLGRVPVPPGPNLGSGAIRRAPSRPLNSLFGS